MKDNRAAVLREILQQLDDDAAWRNELWEEAYRKDQEYEEFMTAIYGDEY